MMNYNTERDKLQMPEYGRHVQKMIDYVVNIEDKDKRNEQIKAVVAVMKILNPQLRDINDFKHKLWDHVQIISDFKIDVDSPYPIPTKESLYTKPNTIPLDKVPLRTKHYGRNIQNMIATIAVKEDSEVKLAMIKTIAEYMRQQYLIWNKDTVSDEIIFRDMRRLSDDRIEIPEGLQLSVLQNDHISRKPMMYKGNNEHRSNNTNNINNKRKKWKKNGNV